MKSFLAWLWVYLRTAVREFLEKDSTPRRAPPLTGEGGAVVLSQPLPLGRSMFAFGVFFALLCCVVARAFWLQCGFNTEFLQQQGERRYERTIALPASRGRILDRNGVVLASTSPARNVWAVPETMAAKATVDQVEALARVLGMKASEIKAKLDAAEDRSFVYLARRQPIATAEAVKALGVPGVYFSDEVIRNYPDGRFSAHVVGFTDNDNKGREGIELAFEKELAGKPGARRVIRDRQGRTVEDVWYKQASPGRDVTLSIDSRLQYIAHEALKGAIVRHRAKAGAVVVADVRTGEILAMSNWPTFDPNDRKTLKMENVRNRVLTDVFEPGSTMKPFAVAKGLNEGHVRPADIIPTGPGKLTIGDRTIGDTHNYGDLTVSQVVSKSSNIGTAKIALDMQPRVLYDMYTALGFGRKPEVGFPGAVRGLLRPAKTWRPIEQATISYGQGVSVSLMQLVRAYTALARDGDVIDLTFRKAAGPATGTPVFKPVVARQMRRMMSDTVRAGGTATRVSVDGYSIAGKTGTANKVKNGRYVDKYVASFVGVAPAGRPRLIVAVMVDEPTKGSHFGGTVAAPVFNEVTSNALRLLGVHPDHPVPAASSGIYVKGFRND